MVTASAPRIVPSPDGTMQDDNDNAASEEEDALAREAQERSAPSGKVVHRAILEEGDEELERPTGALFWSALAAGLSMGASLIAEAALHAALPDAPWRPLVAKLGYSVGFLIVILGRQQLFTENTLTPILPLLERRDLHTLTHVARLWIIVLIGNLVGAALIALLLMKTPALQADIRAAAIEIAHKAITPGVGTIFVRGILAGWLIALIVWLLPFAEAARFFVIVTLAYLVGIASLSHIVAGAVEMFSLGFAGEKDWLTIVTGYLVPTLIGNTIGGVVGVALLAHAQVNTGGEE